MDTLQRPFDDTLLKTMDKLIEKEKKKPKKSFLAAEKRLMYYSKWHRDDKPVTFEKPQEKQQKLKIP